MTVPLPDGSRDRRIEDPTNLWVIHPAGRALLPYALKAGVSANAISVVGLLLGAGAAMAYAHWHDRGAVLLGLLLSAGWLIADGLDGMVARATGTASALGRFLDGACDHGVFALIYLALAASVGTPGGWVLAILAGVAHAVQSSLYEGERARFHRRVKGIAAADASAIPAGNPLVALYDHVAGLPDTLARPFERTLAAAPDPVALGRHYGEEAAPVMKAMAWLTANVRVWAVAAACLLQNPRLFWWFEIVPLTIVAAVCIARHRRVERHVARPSRFTDRDPIASALSTREHRHS
jgi:CDP-diacylglycerol--serine O-phosphatidyltransferase